MRIALVTALGCVLVAATAAGAARPAPIITLKSGQTLSGSRFVPREWVRVTVGTTATRVRANATGRFVVALPVVPIDRCSGAQVRATGSSGDVALLKLPLPACMPQHQP
jgi:hypothetical protein